MSEFESSLQQAREDIDKIAAMDDDIERIQDLEQRERALNILYEKKEKKYSIDLMRLVLS